MSANAVAHANDASTGSMANNGSHPNGRAISGHPSTLHVPMVQSVSPLLSYSFTSQSEDVIGSSTYIDFVNTVDSKKNNGNDDGFANAGLISESRERVTNHNGSGNKAVSRYVNDEEKENEMTANFNFPGPSGSMLEPTTPLSPMQLLIGAPNPSHSPHSHVPHASQYHTSLHYPSGHPSNHISSSKPTIPQPQWNSAPPSSPPQITLKNASPNMSPNVANRNVPNTNTNSNNSNESHHVMNGPQFNSNASNTNNSSNAPLSGSRKKSEKKKKRSELDRDSDLAALDMDGLSPRNASTWETTTTSAESKTSDHTSDESEWTLVFSLSSLFCSFIFRSSLFDVVISQALSHQFRPQVQ